MPVRIVHKEPSPGKQMAHTTAKGKDTGSMAHREASLNESLANRADPIAAANMVELKDPLPAKDSVQGVQRTSPSRVASIRAAVPPQKQAANNKSTSCSDVVSDGQRNLFSTHCATENYSENSRSGLRVERDIGTREEGIAASTVLSAVIRDVLEHEGSGDRDADENCGPIKVLTCDKRYDFYTRARCFVQFTTISSQVTNDRICNIPLTMVCDRKPPRR